MRLVYIDEILGNNNFKNSAALYLENGDMGSMTGGGLVNGFLFSKSFWEMEGKEYVYDCKKEVVYPWPIYV